MNKALKLCAVLLALALCISSLSMAVFAEGFADVAETDYYYEAVMWAVENGITQGVGGGLFDPEGQVNRAQIVTFLWRMQGEPVPEKTATFDDVEAGSWYEVPVCWAVENGITLGTGDNKFSPEAVCDRAMCLTLLYRIMGAPYDQYDFTKEIEVDESSSMEDWGFYLIKEIVWEFRNKEFFSDVHEGDYFELPAIWASIEGIITDDNTGEQVPGMSVRAADPCVRKEMVSFLYQAKILKDSEEDSVLYYAGALKIPIPQKYSELLAIEIDASLPDDADGTLARVSELASMDAAKAKGDEYEGAGELFAIDRVSEDKLHDMLCSDMSGQRVFAKDYAGNYYILRTPTDVRFDRETPEQMQEDADFWIELNEWVSEDVPFSIVFSSDYVTYESFTNTLLDMYLARIAYKGFNDYTVSTTEFGPLDPSVDGKYYAELLLKSGFEEAEEGTEAPDGEYAVLNFPEDNVRYDFFTADKNLVRETRGDYVTLYTASNPDIGEVGPNTCIVLDWYEATAIEEGKKEESNALDAFEGEWVEEIAGRGTLTIKKLLRTGKFAYFEATWPDSAVEEYFWFALSELTEDEKVEYNDGMLLGFNTEEEGGGITYEDYHNRGSFELNDEGKLVWNYTINGNDQTATFVRSNG